MTQAGLEVTLLPRKPSKCLILLPLPLKQIEKQACTTWPGLKLIFFFTFVKLVAFVGIISDFYRKEVETNLREIENPFQ